MLGRGVLPLCMRPVGGWEEFLAGGVLDGGILPLYMRPVGGTSGCWVVGWRNILTLYMSLVGGTSVFGMLGGGI